MAQSYRYLCFVTTDRGEAKFVVRATTDQKALDAAEYQARSVWTNCQIYSSVGVWEKSPEFYSANRASDLADLDVLT